MKRAHRKRRIRIKYKNIFLLLLFITILVILTKFIIFYSFNKKIFNDIKEDNLTIKTNKEFIRLSSKNLQYIKKGSVKVRIKTKSSNYIINNNYLSNKTNIRLDTYKKVIDKKNFNNSMGLILKNNKKISSGQTSIKLPLFLKNKKYIDIYGIKNNKYYKINTYKINNSKVNFNLSKDYNNYLFVHVKLKDFYTDDISILKNRKVKINIKYLPKNATIYNFKYNNIDKNYISIENNYLHSIRPGNTKFQIEINNIKKNVNVNINFKKYEVIKKNDIYYIDGIMLVNKSYPISKDYDPKDLLDVTKKAYEKMNYAASKDGVTLWIVSGYRNYKDQETIYNNYVKINGKENADTYSARPGYSEHQTGYVIDVNDATSNFEGTKAAKWLDDNSYKFGFIIRFPKGKDKYTGYKYEPWHLRYIGKEKAEKIKKSNLSLEEYYGIPSRYKD